MLSVHFFGDRSSVLNFGKGKEGSERYTGFASVNLVYTVKLHISIPRGIVLFSFLIIRASSSNHPKYTSPHELVVAGIQALPLAIYCSSERC